MITFCQFKKKNTDIYTLAANNVARRDVIKNAC